MARRDSVFCRTTCIFMICFSVTAWMQIGRAAQPPEFVATQIYDANTPVFGLACGEFDSSHDGIEIACLLQKGTVLQISPKVPAWQVTPGVLETVSGIAMIARPTLSIGDVSFIPGNEIVLCAGKVIVVYPSSNSDWFYDVIFDNTGMVGSSWGARAGDYDPDHNGEEIFHIYEGVFDFSTGTIFRDNFFWEEEIVYNDIVGMDSAAGEFNPDHPGPEIVVATEGNCAYEILMPERTMRMIWADYPNAGWVVKIADVDPNHPGNELVYGTRYNNRIIMSKHNGTNPHQLEVLFTGNAAGDRKEMVDIAIGDVLPREPGLEILGVDYTGSVYLVRRINGHWQGQVIWQDTDALYAVTVGDFLPVRSGDEILVTGQSGILTLLTLTYTDSISGEGRVNLPDFEDFASSWLQNDPSSDISPWPIGDGIVNMSDLAALAGSWLKKAYWAD